MEETNHAAKPKATPDRTEEVSGEGGTVVFGVVCAWGQTFGDGGGLG